MKIKSKSGLKVFTYEDIKSWNPCYDPIKFIPNTWRGTAIDILDLKDVPCPDRLWVVLRTSLISEKCMRLFAVWSARQVQHLMVDQRSVNALNIVEQFANGSVSKDDLTTARYTATAAAAAVTSAATAFTVAAYAANAAATAAYAATAAWTDSNAAAHVATAATSAVTAATYASNAAVTAAANAARDAQVSKIKEMIIAEGKERIEKRGNKYE